MPSSMSGSPSGTSAPIDKPSFHQQMESLALKLADGTLDTKNEEDRNLLNRADRYESLRNQISKRQLPEKYQGAFKKVKDQDNIKGSPDEQVNAVAVLKLREDTLKSPTSLARARKIFGGEIRSKTAQLEIEKKQLTADLVDSSKDLNYYKESYNRILKEIGDAESALNSKEKKVDEAYEKIKEIDKDNFEQVNIAKQTAVQLGIMYDDLNAKLFDIKMENQKLKAKIDEMSSLTTSTSSEAEKAAQAPDVKTAATGTADAPMAIVAAVDSSAQQEEDFQKQVREFVAERVDLLKDFPAYREDIKDLADQYIKVMSASTSSGFDRARLEFFDLEKKINPEDNKKKDSTKYRALKAFVFGSVMRDADLKIIKENGKIVRDKDGLGISMQQRINELELKERKAKSLILLK